MKQLDGETAFSFCARAVIWIRTSPNTTSAEQNMPLEFIDTGDDVCALRLMVTTYVCEQMALRIYAINRQNQKLNKKGVEISKTSLVRINIYI
jgi:methionine synthase I (cobalamin-dependent)